MDITSHAPWSPYEASVAALWRGNGRRDSTIRVYLRWARHFHRSCAEAGLDVSGELTRSGVAAFSVRYCAGRRGDGEANARGACSALRAWNLALRALGQVVPDWHPVDARRPTTSVLAEFEEFRRNHAGVSDRTIQRDLKVLSSLLGSPRLCSRPLADLRLRDVDEFVADASSRWCRKTLAVACSVIRQFLRFLHATGRVPHDIASSVASPVVRRAERPPRALPWSDVQRLLGAVDAGTASGRRDYALLLVMATYGMGAAEALSLTLEQIDWRTGVIHLVRPKTGVATHLPLLPAVGEALVRYLQTGRPRHSTTRAVFVSAHAPHGAMTPSAVRHSVRAHALAAGLRASVLGGHVLRHSHACRQVELGAAATIVGDILGHRDPSSTSAYIRVATSRLRALALPVPGA